MQLSLTFGGFEILGKGKEKKHFCTFAELAIDDEDQAEMNEIQREIDDQDELKLCLSIIFADVNGYTNTNFDALLPDKILHHHQLSERKERKERKAAPVLV